MSQSMHEGDPVRKALVETHRELLNAGEKPTLYGVPVGTFSLSEQDTGDLRLSPEGRLVFVGTDQPVIVFPLQGDTLAAAAGTVIQRAK